MLKIQKFIDDNYRGGLASIEFLRDAMAYMNSRVEERNADKPISQLLIEYVEVRGVLKKG